ncbi:MAG: LTA synthase family protein [Clostridia bacterium]|nr:LTA synthase family protein [Clostridia bacterium]
MNIFLEAALRRSFLEAFALIISDPIVFGLNTLIVFASFSLVYIFRRRTFVFSLISICWYIIVFVSYYMMCQRTTPFNASDFRVVRSTFEIIGNYLSVLEIILYCCVFIFAVFMLSLIFRKCKKRSTNLALSAFFPVEVWSLVIISIVLYTNLVVNSARFDNLPNKYREHGFAFCFLYSLVDNGIDKPQGYTPQVYNESKSKVDMAVKGTEKKKPELVKSCAEELLLNDIYEKVVESYNQMPEYLCLDFSQEQAQAITSHLEDKFEKYVEASSSDSSSVNVDNPDDTKKLYENDMPNIIFLQLESFYDVTNIEGYEYSSHPHPIYSMLKEKLPGGFLTVPSIGAGTANTEFEIITGMDVSLFGIAEYPYLSVLQNQTCESMAYNAKDYGYNTHVIHNHKGTFYDRNKVFPNLGFDTFSSLENIPVIIRNQRNWGKDAMLIDPILDTLKSTEGQDLIYTISVQPHGRYPSQEVYERHLMGQEPRVKVSGNDLNPENPSFTYYVNQLSEVDTFIGNLILELGFIDEPTILVFYGDHLPAFSVQKYWKLKEGNCYQTDYMIWNNCGIDFSDAKDLTTYQLCSYIFSKVDIDSGDVNKLNRLYLENNTEDYHYLRHVYQYAIFEDKSLRNTSSEIVVPDYQRVNTQYGIHKTHLSDIYTIDDTTYITGSRFNEFTKVTVNGDTVSTKIIDSNTISISHKLEVNDIIGTNQIAVNQAILGESENTITYTSSMIIDKSRHEEVLEALLPREEELENPNDGVIDDATLEFVTGQDEMDMVQQDINKVSE